MWRRRSSFCIAVFDLEIHHRFRGRRMLISKGYHTRFRFKVWTNISESLSTIWSVFDWKNVSKNKDTIKVSILQISSYAFQSLIHSIRSWSSASQDEHFSQRSQLSQIASWIKSLASCRTPVADSSSWLSANRETVLAGAPFLGILNEALCSSVLENLEPFRFEAH